MNKLNDLLLHPSTKKRLEEFTESPSHGVLISGEQGSGKLTVSKSLAASLLNLKSPLENYPYLFHLSRPEGKQDIPIENIRSTIISLQLKVPGKGKINKIVIIEDAQYLSIPAQNALLKSLEEPSDDTVFILTSDLSSNLLPTVISRVQEIKITPPDLKSAIKYWHDKHDENEIKSAWQLSQGATGLLSALLSDANHPLKNSVSEAKNFLTQNTYKRILIVDRLIKNKGSFAIFLNALSKILRVLHMNSVKNGKVQQSENILASRKAVLDTIDALNNNANGKLAAMRLVLNMKV